MSAVLGIGLWHQTQIPPKDIATHQYPMRVYRFPNCGSSPEPQLPKNRLSRMMSPTSPESTIASFIEKNGGKGGMHHIAFAVENLEGQLADAEAAGIRLIDKAPRGGAEGLSIAFLHPKSTAGILTEFCEKK